MNSAEKSVYSYVEEVEDSLPYIWRKRKLHNITTLQQ